MIGAFTINSFYFLLEGAGQTLLLSLIAFIGGGIGGLLVALARTAPVGFVARRRRRLHRYFSGYAVADAALRHVFRRGLPRLQHQRLDRRINRPDAERERLLRRDLARRHRGGAERRRARRAPALGLRYVNRMRYVVLPQAFKLSLAPTVGYLVQIIKGTSLAAIIGFAELMRAGQIVSNTTYKPLLVYGIVGALYFIICWPLSLLSDLLERRLSVAPLRSLERWYGRKEDDWSSASYDDEPTSVSICRGEPGPRSQFWAPFRLPLRKRSISIKKKGVIVIGVQADQIPWGSIDANGQNIGYDVDVANLIGEDMGVKVQLERVTVPTPHRATRHGKSRCACRRYGHVSGSRQGRAVHEAVFRRRHPGDRQEG